MRPKYVFNHWEQVRIDLLATIEKFSDDELSFIPCERSWQVGKIMLHIAECEDHWLHAVVRHELEPPVRYALADHPTKAAISSVLNSAHSRTIQYLDSLEEADLWQEYQTRFGETFSLYWIIWHVLEHEIHHRGELSLALGMLGREGLDV
jgi:uncharacterized damage-inducible protein DinB